jgi:hypothetical protein
MKIESQSIHKFKNMFVKFFFPVLRFFFMNLYEVGCQELKIVKIISHQGIHIHLSKHVQYIVSKL